MALNRAETGAKLDEMLAAAKEQLWSISNIDLMALPETTELTSQHPLSIFHYHVVTPDGEHQFVIQASYQLLGGLMDVVKLDGFVVLNDGSRRNLTEEEKWDYS